MKATTPLTLATAAVVLLGGLSPMAPALASPPDPNNAALLYYQAFLLMAQTDDHTVTDSVAEVANGVAAPDEKVREYVHKCRSAIDYAVMASNLPHCDWGLAYSQGFSALLPHLGQARALARLILAEARILNADGDYRQALERCLATYRLAGQLGDNVLVSVLVSAAISAQANKGVSAILDLTW